MGDQKVVAGFVDDDFFAGFLIKLLVGAEALVERVQ